MPFTRRDFLRVTIGASLLAASGYLFLDIFRPFPLTRDEQETLEALLDTLIPEDETPGALQLGVAEKIKARAAGENTYRRLIKKGCAWLDRSAGKLDVKSFAALRQENRDAVMTRAVESTADSLPGIFIRQMRSDAFHHYYGHPKSWVQLGYNGPPQPNGFPDYDKAPSPHR